MSAAIEVLEVRLARAGSLKAFAKVRLGCITIHSCRIIQRQLPARRKVDGAGSGWAPVVEITNPAVLAALREAVLAAWSAG